MTASVQALQQERVLYQDDPTKRQRIEAQERQLLSGITGQEWQSAKLAPNPVPGEGTDVIGLTKALQNKASLRRDGHSILLLRILLLQPRMWIR